MIIENKIVGKNMWQVRACELILSLRDTKHFYRIDISHSSSSSKPRITKRDKVLNVVSWGSSQVVSVIRQSDGGSLRSALIEE